VLSALRAGLSAPSPSSLPSPGPSGDARRRAPRALTGRYVRSGTGASKPVLEVLRRKIVERMRLKELLGPENSQIYFGPLNKQKKGSGMGGGAPAAAAALAAAAAAGGHKRR